MGATAEGEEKNEGSALVEKKEDYGELVLEDPATCCNIDGLVQDCNYSSALALELL